MSKIQGVVKGEEEEEEERERERKRERERENPVFSLFAFF